MSKQNRITIKTYFETGDVPTQSQFSDSFDSQVFWDDDVVTDLTSNDDNHVPTVKAVVDAIAASTPTTYEQITLTDFNTLVGASGLVVGKWYKVTSAYTHPIIGVMDIVVQADGTSSFDVNRCIGYNNSSCPFGANMNTNTSFSFGIINGGFILLDNTQILLNNSQVGNNYIYPSTKVVIKNGGSYYSSQILKDNAFTVNAQQIQLQNVFDLKNQVFGTYDPTTSTFTPNAVASGNVVGPASAVDANIAVFDNTTGKLIKDGGKTISQLVLSNTAITGATKTKITYDSKGLVTSGADATTADIADSTNKRYVTDAELAVLANTSGVNTGDETTTSIGALINGATSKTTPVDADYFGLMDSAASNILKKLSWLNLKATLKTYSDTLYTTTSAVATQITTALSGYLTAATAASTYQTILGFTPANVANNLSDLANSTTARANLKMLQADLSATVITTSATASAITGLSFTAVANKTYFIEGSMKIGCSGGGGVKISATLPSGATVGIGLIGTASSQANTSQSTIDASATLTSIAFCSIASSAGVLHFKGTIDISSTGGTVQFNFASGTNTQTSSVFKLGTFLIATEK